MVLLCSCRGTRGWHFNVNSGGGWLALEHHDMIPIGLAEPLFTKLSDSHADGIVRDIDRLPVRA